MYISYLIPFNLKKEKEIVVVLILLPPSICSSVVVALLTKFLALPLTGIMLEVRM